jgi:hypothetical protein
LNFNEVPFASGTLWLPEPEETTENESERMEFRVYERYGMGVFNQQGVAKTTIKKEEYWTFEF